MRFCSATIVGLVTVASTLVQARPQLQYVVHEKRDILPHAWEFASPADPSTTVLTKIGLIQPNLDKGHDYLTAVSDPRSPTYGQHWTAAQVAEYFAPKSETIKAVQEWLVSAGIERDRISLSKGNSWLSFNAKVEELQDLLKTTYAVYLHKSGRTYIGSEVYHVPASLKDEIDFITPTVQFDTAVKISSYAKRDTSHISVFGPGPKVEGPHKPNLASDKALSNCGGQVTPDCLRAM